MKIIIQFMICLMIWVVVEAGFIGSPKPHRYYIIQNQRKEVKIIAGLSIKGNTTNKASKVLLIIGDRVEEYKQKTAWWTGIRYKKIEYTRN